MPFHTVATCVRQSTIRGRAGHALVLLLACASLLACSLRSAQPTVLDALTEFPGMLGATTRDTAQLLRQQAAAGGQIVVYRYPPPERIREPTCLGMTFVTPVGRGWRAQSSGYFETCDFGTLAGFHPAWTPGGNITDLTTAWGTSDRGTQVRVQWSDGQITLAPIEQGVFIDAREAVLQVVRVDLLDADGRVLESVDV